MVLPRLLPGTFNVSLTAPLLTLDSVTLEGLGSGLLTGLPFPDSGGALLQVNSENASEDRERPHPLSRIFFGSEGLRAGWSALLFISIFLLLGSLIHFLFATLSHGAHSSKNAAGAVTLGELLALALCLLATAIMARIEDRPFTSYGLAGERKVMLSCVGACWGFFFLSLLIGGLYLTHSLSFEAGHLPAGSALKYAAIWLFGMLLVALFEETLLRGYLQWTLARGVGFWWAALILSFSFGVLHGHNPGESPIGLFSAGAIGLVLCLSIWYTGSLWWAIGFHTAWDWGESYFYGTANSGVVVTGHFLTAHPAGKLWMSGGNTGPEGSLLVLPIILLVALVLYFTLGSRIRWQSRASD